MKLNITDSNGKLSNRNKVKFHHSFATLKTKIPLTVVESKIVFKVISQIDIKDEELKLYNIDATELHREIYNLTARCSTATKLNKKEKLELFCETLKSKTLYLPTANSEDFEMVSWFIKFNYISNENVIKCQIHPDLKPYFLNFKNNYFKKTDYYNLSQFSNKYTHKFYLLLKTVNSDSYVVINNYGKNIPIQWMRNWLGINKNQ